MRKLLIALSLVFFAATAVTAQDDPAALVVRLQGDVQIRPAGGEPAPAAVGARLAVGDEVIPAPGSRAFLVLRTGATQAVTEPTTVEEPRGAGNPDMFNRALQVLAQAATTDTNTGARQGMIRPIPGEPVLVSPRNGLTVTSTRPTFTWMTVDGATGYTIQIRRLNGGRPVRFQVGPDSVWTLPPEVPALLPGQEYAWTIAPTRGRPTREQRFHVVGPEQFRQMSEDLAMLADMGLQPDDDGLFMAAVVYRDLNMFYDAAAVLEAMETGDFPLTAELYLLKGDILAAIGDEAGARRAFDMADEMMR